MTAVVRRLSFALAALFIASAPARADEFTITGGSIELPGNARSPHFTLTGDGFLFSGFGEPNFSNCSPCTPGQTIALRTTLTDVFSFGGAAAGMFNGTAYPVIFLNGILRASSDTFPVSMLLDSLTVSLPFTAAGRLWGYQSSSDAVFGNNPLFEAVDFVGSGTATGTFSRGPDFNGAPLFDFRSSTFTFEPASTSPTPEPATLLLVGLGAMSAFFHRRRPKGLR